MILESLFSLLIEKRRIGRGYNSGTQRSYTLDSNSHTSGMKNSNGRENDMNIYSSSLITQIAKELHRDSLKVSSQLDEKGELQRELLIDEFLQLYVLSK